MDHLSIKMGHIKHSSIWVWFMVLLPLVLEGGQVNGVSYGNFYAGITCQTPGYSITAPSSVSVQEGLCVTIPCNFTTNSTKTFTNSTGYWKRWPPYSSYIAATNDKSSPGQKPNFHLTGNPDMGDCTLTITDARKEDTGRYYYRFVESKDSPVRYNYINPSSTITVADLTEEPVFSDLGTVIADVDKTLTCSAPGNCPATSLVFQWKKSNVAGIWKKNSSTITFTPSLDDHQQNITCEMTNSKGKTTQKTILLDVCYPSRNMEITIISTTGGERPASQKVAIDETEMLTLVCRGEGNPTISVVWVKGEVDTETSTKYNSGSSAMINVTSSLVDVYQCLAWNMLGLRERRIQVGARQVTVPIWYTAIAFICGMSIIILMILLYKLVTRKKINKQNYVKAEEMCTSADSPKEEMYTNVSKPKLKAEAATDNNIQPDTSGETQIRGDVHYATVTFTAKPSKVPLSQPESEYAQILKK